MSNLYLPEGRLLHTPENQRICAALPLLRAAMEQGTVLEGQAVWCTPEHDLSVSLGTFQRTIPREEAALGIREGTAKEIAILSRVGKPVAFTVTDIAQTAGGPILRLSRRRAQVLALEHLLTTPPGTVLPAIVTHLEGFGAFVDVGCGLVSMIPIEHCSVSRIAHPACRFAVGQEIFAVLTGGDRERQRLTLSHKELLGTWEENAQRFSPGMTVPGYVRGIKSYGSFIELAPNFTGLTDRTEGLQEGGRVSVCIKGIYPEKMKVKLAIIETLPPSPQPEPFSYFITRGRLEQWTYSPPEYLREPILRDFTSSP